MGAVSASFSLRGLDETVDSFEDSIVDSGGEPAEDAVLVFAYGCGNLNDGGRRL